MPKAMALLLLLAMLAAAAQASTIFNVMSFRARGDGVGDDTQAFLAAWNEACRVPKATILVPKGHTFLVSPVTFIGPCQPGMTWKMEGTVVAPPTPYNWPEEYEDTWIGFHRATRFVMQGGGVFDGSGPAWWSVSCKRNKASNCKQRLPAAVKFEGGSDILVFGITIRNSQNRNLVINNAERARVTAIEVQNPEESPNTDGIDLGNCKGISIDHCKITTGDDCIAIGTGSANVIVDNVLCGPGHGISVGSLGKGNSVANVSNILVQNSVLKGTTNGVRIKTWQGGSGSASGIRFENITMIHVENPIIIDQFYCDTPNGRSSCPQKSTNVQVSDVTFQNIDGTSATAVATKLNCSRSNPCRNINFHNINLKLPNGAAANAFCSNAIGNLRVLPHTCSPN